jgi:hypothetical protein
MSEICCVTHCVDVDSLGGQVDRHPRRSLTMRYTPAPVHPVTSFVRRLDSYVWMCAHALSWVCGALFVTIAVVGVVR